MLFSCHGRRVHFLTWEQVKVLMRRACIVNLISLSICNMGFFQPTARCIPIRLLVTTFNNSNNLLELSFHAYKMNPDPNPNPNLNPNNPNNLLDTIILLGYNVRIE